MVIQSDARADRPLSTWENTALDAVAGVIEFWGFKRNQGRLWTLLYLRGIPMNAVQLQSVLELSKGAVSMVTRELEQWNVISRLRFDGSNSWHFVAETSLIKMVSNVFRNREAALLNRVRTELGSALQEARDEASPEVLDRLSRLRLLAQMAERAIVTLATTSKLNLSSFFNVLRAGNLAKKAPAPSERFTIRRQAGYSGRLRRRVRRKGAQCPCSAP